MGRSMQGTTRVHLLQTGARRVLERLFAEVGLPDSILTDNGTPFASTGIHGLCSFNVWWLQLGIVQQRIPPSSPTLLGRIDNRTRKITGTFPVKDVPGHV